MIADAEAHRAEDLQLRQVVDARNELQSAANQVERRLNELGDAVPAHERSRAEMLVAEAREATKPDADTPLERFRSLTAELQGIFHGLGVGGGAREGDGRAAPPPDATSGDDDVIDAEFTAS